MKNEEKDPARDHFNTHAAAMFGGGLHLLNTSIVPPGADGRWIVETVTPEWASGLVQMLVQDGAGWPSIHIGHDATATVAGEIFRLGEIKADRTPWDGRGLGLALQLRGRIPEGAILDRAQMDAIGYDLRVLYRLAEDGLPIDAFRPGLRSAKDAEALRLALCGSDVKITFVRRKASRSGGHVYYGAVIRGFDFDAGQGIVSVLRDPLARLPKPASTGYSGSAREKEGGSDPHNLTMVWVGEGNNRHAGSYTDSAVSVAEVEALTNLCRQIAVAIGWDESRIIPWEVL